MTCIGNTSLPPEYRNAAVILDEHLLKFPHIAGLDFIPLEIKEEGNISIISKEFKSRDIPAGKTWRWNQVKSRKQVLLTKTRIRVEIFKLMPRKVSKDSALPNETLKLWQYNIFDCNLCVKMKALWCERGITKKLAIEDFKFLAEFMDETLAREFWPKKNEIFYF